MCRAPVRRQTDLGFDQDMLVPGVGGVAVLVDEGAQRGRAGKADAVLHWLAIGEGREAEALAIMISQLVGAVGREAVDPAGLVAIIDAVDAVARPAGFLTVNAGLSYLHARSRNPLAPDVTYVDLTPTWTWNVGSTVDVPISDEFSGRLRLDLSYRDKMHDFDPIRADTGSIVGFGIYNDVTLLNGRFTVHDKRTGIDLSVYARNLLNQYYESRISSINGLAIDFANIAEPRVVGVELRFPFGAMRR